MVGLWKAQSFPGEHSRNPCFWRQTPQVAFSLRYFSTSNNYALQRRLWLSELGERGGDCVPLASSGQKAVLRRFSHARLFLTPWTAARQAPPSIGFSRQEYCSGSPCPSPGDLPNPGTEPTSPALQVDSLPSEPPEKPKNTGVGGRSLHQGNFPAQESNWGLLHCRWILTS